MVTYVSLIKFTEQGMKQIKDSPKRLEAFGKAAKAAGVKLTSAHYTLGEYDLVLVTEAPDEEALLKVLLAQLSHGNVKSTTMRAFSPAQMKELVKEPA